MSGVDSDGVASFDNLSVQSSLSSKSAAKTKGSKRSGKKISWKKEQENSNLSWFSATHILQLIPGVNLGSIDVDFWDFHIFISLVVCVFVGLLLFLAERFRVDGVPNSVLADTAQISYVDAFFQSTAAFCGGGLSAVNIGVWSNPSLVILIFQMLFGCPMVGSVVFVVMRIAFLSRAIKRWDRKYTRSPDFDRLIFHRHCFLVALRIMVTQWFVFVALGMIIIAVTIDVSYAGGKRISFSRSDGTSCSTLLDINGDVLSTEATNPVAIACANLDTSVIRYLNPWWWSLFHSVSAISNTGFLLDPNGLLVFQNDYVILITFGVLLSVGGSYFPVVLWLNFRFLQAYSRDNDVYYAILHECHVFILNLFNKTLTKILALYSLFLSSVAIIVLASNEWENAIFSGAGSTAQKLLEIWITVISTRFAGFNTFPLANMHVSSILVIMALMYLPSLPVVDSTLPANATTGFFSIFSFHGRAFISRWTSHLFFAVFLITIIEEHHGSNPFDLLFCCFDISSAFGTVGWSLGAPPGVAEERPGVSFSGYLTDASKLVMMYILQLGRARDLNAFTNQLRQVEIRGPDWPASINAVIVQAISSDPSQPLRHSFDGSSEMYQQSLDANTRAGLSIEVPRGSSVDDAYLPSRHASVIHRIASKIGSEIAPAPDTLDVAGVFSSHETGSARSSRDWISVPSPSAGARSRRWSDISDRDFPSSRGSPIFSTSVPLPTVEEDSSPYPMNDQASYVNIIPLPALFVTPVPAPLAKFSLEMSPIGI